MTTTYTPKNILITGGAGFIASHVTNRLVGSYPDYNIVVLDKLDYCSSLKNLQPSSSSPNFKFVKGDIASADLVNYLLVTESIDTILHFAAQTHVDNSFGNSFEFTQNNIFGTHVLLETCKNSGQIKRFVHVSTDEVYGETDEDAVVGIHEASQLLPTNPYSATKAGAEMLVMAYGRSYGLPVITTRGNNVYGPNQFPEKLVPKFILLAMRGKNLPIHGDGFNVRSYLYCEDVAEAFEVILHKGEVGNAYNIGTKKERRVIDVANDICKLFSLLPDSTIKYVENRPFNDQRYFIEDQKLKNLGWVERTSWEVGLRKTMEWYTSHPDWWGDVSGALLPHPRMLVMAGSERLTDGSEDVNQFVSQKTTMPSQDKAVNPSLKFLIYGGHDIGFIGRLLGNICEKQGISYEFGKGNLEERSHIAAEIQRVKPTHVFNASEVSQRRNIDWFETNKTSAIRINFLRTLNLADVCREHGIPMVHYGYMYECDAELPNEARFGIEREERSDTSLSYYSKTSAMAENFLEDYDNVCTIRVHMPVSSDLSSTMNTITWLPNLENKVINFPCIMTILDEILPISMEMAIKRYRGTWNLTNPGIVSYHDILRMYKSYINPNIKLASFPSDKLENGTVHSTSNGADASKLKSDFPELLPVKDSLIKFVFEPNKKYGGII